MYKVVHYSIRLQMIRSLSDISKSKVRVCVRKWLEELFMSTPVAEYMILAMGDCK